MGWRWVVRTPHSRLERGRGVYGSAQGSGGSWQVIRTPPLSFGREGGGAGVVGGAWGGIWFRRVVKALHSRLERGRWCQERGGDGCARVGSREVRLHARQTPHNSSIKSINPDRL